MGSKSGVFASRRVQNAAFPMLFGPENRRFAFKLAIYYCNTKKRCLLLIPPLDSRGILFHAAPMQTDAFERSLRAFVRRAPFQPFTVELTSGTRFQVLHPEALAFNGG